MDKQLLLGMSLQQLQDVTAELGMPRFSAKQIMQWLYQKNITEIDDMTNLSKTHRQRLTDCCLIGRSMPIETQTSEDGTEKYLFKTVDGHYVETVYIPDHERATLCVSSQVGCKMNCEFCQTGKQGFNGNLTPADILNQIYTVNTLHIADGGLTNIVFMGQGEPLDNYDAVKQTIIFLLTVE